MGLSSPFVVSFPRNFTSDLDGYEVLAALSLDTYNFKKRIIILDLINNEYFDANLCAPLGCLIELLTRGGNEVAFSGIQAEVETTLKENGFFHLINNGEDVQPSFAKIVDCNHFTLSDTAAFQEYIHDQLLGHENFPKMSTLLKKKINKSIFEIFNNAHIHGNCDKVFTCGQFQERANLLKFCISDMGVTIRKNVNQYHGSGDKISGAEAIEWAVFEGNTTKKGQVPGGLGLSLIRDFLRLNGGGIQIISSNGYWHENRGELISRPLKKRFLGTIVNLEFNLADKSMYVLASEVDFKDIL